MSRTDPSHHAKVARNKQRGRSHGGSTSADNGIANGGATQTGGKNTAGLKDQLPWAPVLLNPKRLASAAIGTLRRGANYSSQLPS
jgi:hypothetical protein